MTSDLWAVVHAPPSSAYTVYGPVESYPAARRLFLFHSDKGTSPHWSIVRLTPPPDEENES